MTVRIMIACVGSIFCLFLVTGCATENSESWRYTDDSQSPVRTSNIINKVNNSAQTEAAAVTPKTKSKALSSCDPNYSGCVPVDSDVDCAGGSGNGPSYVSGPVRVVGSDIYGLDRDGDGYGCE